MPRTYIKVEYFQYIEQKGSVTVTEFSGKFGLPRGQAANWLSRWTGRGFLRFESYDGKTKGRKRRLVGRPKDSRGRYYLGKNWWGELVHGSAWDWI